MKHFYFSVFVAAVAMISAGADALAQQTGIYLSGTMNGWADTDPEWEFTEEPDTPGWAWIDLSNMPAGTEFRIKGQGRDFGMKNTRNTIRRNSLHLMTNEGTYNLTAGDDGLDGVHLMVQTTGFATEKYLGIITRTEETETVYGACMESSVTPSVLSPVEDMTDIVSGDVEITEPWYVIKAYVLSNATQTVCNYGLSGSAASQLVPTDNLEPTASPIPVPAEGEGSYKVNFNTLSYVYSLGDDLGPVTAVVGIVSETDTQCYTLDGLKIAQPARGQIYIEKSPEGRTTLRMAR